MPYDFTRDDKLDVTRLAFKGRVDLNHLLEGVRAARSLTNHSFRTLLVVSPETEPELSSRDLRLLARALREERPKNAPHGRTAIVAPSDLAFGLARMTQVFMEDNPSDVQVFHGEVEATEWLIT